MLLSTYQQGGSCHYILNHGRHKKSIKELSFCVSFVVQKAYLISLMLLILPLCMTAQIIDGTWEGTITLERPGPKKEYKFELVLKKKGKEVVGTSYIYYEDQEPVAMNLSGHFFYDRSMRLFNYDVLYPNNDPNKERHIRKYQLMYRRSAFTPDTIEGHWQEKNDPIFATYRKGKVHLTRKKSKTKA